MSQSPIKTDILPPVEWDFDAVPNFELVACCYWEYARESEFIRSTVQRLRAFNGSITLDAAGKRLQRDVESIWSIGKLGWILANPAGLSDPPWQTLSVSQKTKFLEITRSRRPPFNWEWWTPIAKMLHESAETYSAGREVRVEVTVPTWGTVYRPKTRSRAAKGKPQHCANVGTTNKPRVEWADKAQTVMLTIAWGDYTNDQLAVKFRRWLKENRPKDIPQPDKRGVQLRHWRVALRRLGIMRLNYHCTRDRLRSWCPVAWEIFRDHYKEWYAAPHEAKKLFHKLFPFLDAKEDPIHLRPKRKQAHFSP